MNNEVKKDIKDAVLLIGIVVGITLLIAYLIAYKPKITIAPYVVWFLVAKELSFCLMRVCNKALQMNPYNSFSDILGILIWEGKICNWACYALCLCASIWGEHWWTGLVLLVAGFIFPIIWGFVGVLLEFIEFWVAIILAPIACVLMFIYLF